jgi:CubicO group peptidase (beta-lactamase class C family)
MDFSAVDAALQQEIDLGVLPGVSYAILRGGDLVASRCLGWADREQGVRLREDHLFRVFSNTKLATSLAVLQLVEQGRCGLDDLVADYLPALRAPRVLRPEATSIEDAAPSTEPLRLRHLLTHTAGFTYSFTDPGAPLGQAYVAARVHDRKRTLAEMVASLEGLPLLFTPGTDWNYSIAIDIAGHLLEVVTGQKIDAYLRTHIFEPLQMRDTFFFVPPEKHDRLAALYVGDPRSPGGAGLRRADEMPYPGAFLAPEPRVNPGGGLVSSLGDMCKLLAVLQANGAPLLRPSSMARVFENQLPPGVWITTGGQRLPGRGHSFAASVTVQASELDPASHVGDVQWGGLAGTKWLVSPRGGYACALMTQRYMGYDLPYWDRFRALVRGVMVAH